jgi:hypothetical protein
MSGVFMIAERALEGAIVFGPTTCDLAVALTELPRILRSKVVIGRSESKLNYNPASRHRSTRTQSRNWSGIFRFCWNGTRLTGRL